MLVQVFYFVTGMCKEYKISKLVYSSTGDSHYTCFHYLQFLIPAVVLEYHEENQCPYHQHCRSYHACAEYYVCSFLTPTILTLSYCCILPLHCGMFVQCSCCYICPCTCGNIHFYIEVIQKRDILFLPNFTALYTIEF